MTLHADEMRAYFREHGWSIHMDDRPGQAFDPFAVFCEDARLDAARQPDDDALVERLARAQASHSIADNDDPEMSVPWWFCRCVMPEEHAAAIARAYAYAQPEAPQPASAEGLEAIAERDRLRLVVVNAIDNIAHGRYGFAIRQLRAGRALFQGGDPDGAPAHVRHARRKP